MQSNRSLVLAILLVAFLFSILGMAAIRPASGQVDSPLPTPTCSTASGAPIPCRPTVPPWPTPLATWTPTPEPEAASIGWTVYLPLVGK